jgi:uncharacterized protein (TIGR01777 family)
MIGRALTSALIAKGYEVTILTRRIPPIQPQAHSSPALHYARWDPETGTIDQHAIEKADHLVLLSGANVGKKRWTNSRKKEIVDSRVNAAQLVIRSLRTIPNQVNTIVCASAIGYYGPDPGIPHQMPFRETDPPAGDFLARTSRTTEEAVAQALDIGKRLVCLRTGVVLSPAGGALFEFLRPLRFGIAAILGSGRQQVSWIHIDDLVNIYIMALENRSMSGPYNAVSPKPVSNRELVLGLAREVRGKWFIPFRVPTLLLKIVFGELSLEVLKSATVNSERIRQAGFQFEYPELAKALSHLMKRHHMERNGPSVE